MAKKVKRKVKFKTKLKRWWKGHWDEVMLLSSISVSIVLLLWGLGII